MQKNNICKFINDSKTEILNVHSFIYEKEIPHSGARLRDGENKIYLIAGGKGTLRQNGSCRPLKEGDLFFTFAALPYIINNIDGLRYFYIGFSGGKGATLMERFGVTPTDCLFENMKTLLPFWEESLTRSDEQTLDLLSESVLLYSFSKLKKNAGSSTVTMLSAYLEEHFTDSTLSLEKIAEHLGYNSKYLSHIFKKHFGLTFSEYLRLLRIKHAILLLENGVTSVQNIALLSGFSDPLYFSKVFAKEMGCSPREYLKQK